ncbi:MAG: serine aminopeptidase domain-containing protein [Pleurocapsa sp.]
MAVDNNNPQFLLFAQHGWADTGNCIGRFAKAAVDHRTIVIAPSLGLIRTFIRIEPLIKQLEKIAAEIINNYPNIPIKIVGHSMGGLMWLEVLDRNPQWWEKIHSLILLGSPVGGSNIARIIDPFNFGIGTAGDLGKNRRDIAAKIARKIPTLSVASETGLGTDGLVTVENTKFDFSNWLLISGISHNAMRYHPDMMAIMQNFWANPQLGLPPEETPTNQFIRRLRSLPGMTDTDYRDFKRSQIIASFPDHNTLHTWRNNPLGVNHVYLGKQQQCLYAGYVGLIHDRGLRQAIKDIQKYSLPNI